MNNVVIAYTDGACKGNPGPGGWGVVLEYKGNRRELCGGERETTNNRMELTAAIRALEALTRPCHIQIVTDSVYVAKGMSEWMPGWIRNNWKTSAKEPVKNADLWQRLLELQHRHKVEWHWIKGHAGHLGNERADQLANDGIAQLRRNNS